MRDDDWITVVNEINCVYDEFDFHLKTLTQAICKLCNPQYLSL